MGEKADGKIVFRCVTTAGGPTTSPMAASGTYSRLASRAYYRQYEKGAIRYQISP